MEKIRPFEMPSVRARKLNLNFAEAGGGEPSPVTVDSITDASDVGKSVMKAESAADARTAIGAGTSSVAIGTSASQAAAGNHTHGAATTSTAGFMSAADKVKLDGVAANSNAYTLPAAGTALGGVRRGVAVADATEETLLAQLNALLASLRTAGVIAT